MATTRTEDGHTVNRLPKQALQYKPKERRNVGRQRKRWRDQLHLEDQEQETHVTLQERDDDEFISLAFIIRI